MSNINWCQIGFNEKKLNNTIDFTKNTNLREFSYIISKADFILCLAFIHHARLVSNIPLDQILDWLHSLNANIIIEFVDRNDEMVVKLLSNKEEKYEDYNKEKFIELLLKKFQIIDRQSLKDNKRELFFIVNNNIGI